MIFSSPITQECYLTRLLFIRETVPRQLFQLHHANLHISRVKNTKFYSPVVKSSPVTGLEWPRGSRRLRFPDFVTTAQDGGKVVSLTHRPPLPPGNTPGTHFCLRLSRPQGHSAIGRIMSMKNPMTLAGIEPETFRFVAQHLNHCATAVPIPL